MRLILKIGVLVVLIGVLLMPYEYSVSGEFKLLPIQEFGIRSQVASEISEVFIEEGQLVRQGDVVARLVGREQERQLQESRAAYDNVKAKLDLLRGGPKTEKIAKAEQEVSAARTSLMHSEKELKRQEEMFRNKAVPEKNYDEALKIRDLDKEALEVAGKNLNLVRSGAEDEEIRALEAELKLREVEVAFNEKDMELTQLVSPATGRIITAVPGQAVGQYLEVGDLFAIVEDSSKFIVEIEVTEEDISSVKKDAPVSLKTWVYPTDTFSARVTSIGPVAYEKSKGRVVRALSEREWRVEQEETLRDKGKVVRVLAELPNESGMFKSDMTGYAKISCGRTTVGQAFTRWLVRFLLVEVWSWIP